MAIRHHRLASRLRGCIGLCAVCACAWVGPAWAAPWGVAELMQSLAREPSSRASFVERKYLNVVEQPVESRGELVYVAPDRFEKRTTSPRAESLVLAGDELVIERPGKRTLRLNLASYPEAGVFVQSIRGTLAGDLQTLQRHYRVDLTGKPDRWRLVLVPQQERMAKVITRIRIEGEQAQVSFIAFDQADGDRTQMSITPLK